MNVNIFFGLGVGLFLGVFLALVYFLLYLESKNKYKEIETKITNNVINYLEAKKDERIKEKGGYEPERIKPNMG